MTWISLINFFLKAIQIPLSGKRPLVPNKSENLKKKVKFDFDNSLNVKTNFWIRSNKILFHSLKVLRLVYGRMVVLDLLESLHCPLKSLFKFQGWGIIFSSNPERVFDLFVCLFYANLRSSRSGEFETLVMGKPIYLNCAMLGTVLDINYFGFIVFSKNP